MLTRQVEDQVWGPGEKPGHRCRFRSMDREVDAKAMGCQDHQEGRWEWAGKKGQRIKGVWGREIHLESRGLLERQKRMK